MPLHQSGAVVSVCAQACMWLAPARARRCPPRRHCHPSVAETLAWKLELLRQGSAEVEPLLPRIQQRCFVLVGDQVGLQLDGHDAWAGADGWFGAFCSKDGAWAQMGPAQVSHLRLA